MKKLLTLLFALCILASCNNPEGSKPAPKIEDVAYFEWDGNDYWIMQYDSTANGESIKDHLKKSTNIKKLSWVFLYPDTEDNSLFKKEKFNKEDFIATIKKYKPGYTYYKTPNDTTVFEGYEVFRLEDRVDKLHQKYMQ